MRLTLIALSISCVLGFSTPTAAQISTPKPALALAKTAGPAVQVEAYWVSEKMDGARAYWDGAQLRSRNGLVFEAPGWFLRGFPPRPLDGELWMGRGSFERLMQTIRDRVPDQQAWSEVRYWAFDMPEADGDFEQRQQQLQRTLAAYPSDYLRLVSQRRVHSTAELRQQLRAVVDEGGEGLMLQRADAEYRAGRHAGLLKLKPFSDAEARVVAYKPGKGKYRGLVGALMVQDAAGLTFKLGSGLSDADRRVPPAIGSLVSYRYQGRTGKGLPRFARYLRQRPEE